MTTVMIEEIIPGWYRALQRHGPRHTSLTVRRPDGVEGKMAFPYGLNGELDHIFYLPFSPAAITVGDGPACREGETDDFRLERLNPIAAYAVMGHRLLKYLRYDGTRSELARLREFNLGKSVAIVPPRGKLDELYQLIKLRMACRSLPVEHFDQWQDMHMESRRVCAGRMASERDGASVAIVVLAGGGQGPLNATMTSLQGQTRPPTRCFVVDLPGAGERSPSSVTRVGSFAEAVLLAGTSHVWLLQAGDELEPDAVETAQAYLLANPSADCLYCDEVRRIGSVLKPMFKPDYDPVLLAAFDYVGRSRIFPTAQLRQNLWDNPVLSSALPDGIMGEQTVHIPHVLLRSGVVPRDSVNVKGDDSSGNPTVSVIIPTRDNAAVLKSCVTSIREKTAYPNYQIIVVDNGSQCRESLAYHSQLKQEGVEVLEADIEFNYSALNNIGVHEADGSVLAFLNDDVEVVEPGWLQELVGWAVMDGIGSVGAKLLYPDGLLQHAGVVLGLVGVAGHPWKKCDATSPQADFRLRYPRTVSANTGACLVIEKNKFQDVGGFDESLAVAFNDVDLCLRLQRSGCRNVWTPKAVLIHHESYSRGRNDTKDKQVRFLEEKTFMRQRWGHVLCDDPYYNPNLTYEVEDGGLALFPQHLRC